MEGNDEIDPYDEEQKIAVYEELAKRFIPVMNTSLDIAEDIALEHQRGINPLDVFNMAAVLCSAPFYRRFLDIIKSFNDRTALEGAKELVEERLHELPECIEPLIEKILECED